MININSIDKKINLGKAIELEVAKLIKYDSLVTQGSFPFDILINRNNQSCKVEVKFHRFSLNSNNIAYEIFNLYKFEQTGLSVSVSDFWVDVIDNSKELEVYLTETKKLKEHIRDLKNNGKTRFVLGSLNKDYLNIIIGVNDLKKYSEFLGIIDRNVLTTI